MTQTRFQTPTDASYIETQVSCGGPEVCELCAYIDTGKPWNDQSFHRLPDETEIDQALRRSEE